MGNIFQENAFLFYLTQIVPFLYLTTSALYGLDFYREHPLAARFKQPALILTIVTHVVDLGLLTSMDGYRVSYSSYNLMSMVALTLAITYMLIEFTTKNDRTGFFVIAFSAAAELLSAILSAQAAGGGEPIRGVGIGVHVLASIFGFSAIAIAGLYSGMYLVQFRQIRLNRFGFVFQRLPNLEVLELLIMHAVAFGFFFLSITLIAGVIEQRATGMVVNLLEPKLVSLVIIWLIYGISLLIKPLLGWDIKHMAVLLIATFTLITILAFIMSIVSPRFHGTPF